MVTPYLTTLPTTRLSPIRNAYGTASITDNSCAPYFFPDLQKWHILDRGERWSDRICPDGYWEANLFQFFYRAYAKLVQQLPIPFKLEGVQRVDETPAHKSLREALVNTLIHTNYLVMGSTLIKIEPTRIIMRNPGRMLVTIQQYYAGSLSVCRNPLLQNMFRFIGFGEKAGSGADIITKGWEENHWARPTITEQTIQPEYTELILDIVKPVSDTVSNEVSNTVSNTVPNWEGTTAVVLQLIKDNPNITRKMMAEKIGIAIKNVQEHINKLKAGGAIRRSGSATFGGHWEVIE